MSHSSMRGWVRIQVCRSSAQGPSCCCLSCERVSALVKCASGKTWGQIKLQQGSLSPAAPAVSDCQVGIPGSACGRCSQQGPAGARL